MVNYKIRPYKVSDIVDSALLIRHTFGQYNYGEGDAESVASYLDQFNPSEYFDSIVENFARTEVFYVAESVKGLVGLIRGTPFRVVSLFVASSVHGNGIGSALLKHYELECQSKGSYEILVRSSIYAISFYQRHGYKKTTGVRRFRKLNVQPMKKRIA